MKTTNVFGIHSILEAIKSDTPIEKVWLLKGGKSKLYDRLIYTLKSKTIPFSFVPEEKLEQLSKKNHQRAVARISSIKTFEMEPLIEEILEKKELPVFILLDSITDVHNFGAIIRSSVAAGVDAVFTPISNSAPLNGDVVKTSAGNIFHIPISKVKNLKDVIYTLKANEVSVVAMTEKAEEKIYNKPLNVPIAIVLGSEEKGISKGLLEIIDSHASIPMQKEINSLNVSVACGITLFEIVRQRI